MRYENENIWLTQKMMATLYDVDVRTINEHLKKVFDDGELTDDEATVRNFRIVKAEGGPACLAAGGLAGVARSGGVNAICDGPR